MTSKIDLDLLYRLLDVEDHESLYWMLRVARIKHYSLPPFVLSVIEHEGHALGTGSGDELRRARQRFATYEHLLSILPLGVRVLKGPSLARRYPGPLLRPVGDLDLVVTEQSLLWRIVEQVRALHPAKVGVSMAQWSGRTHLVAELAWASADPLLDSYMKVDIFTCAYPGDLAAIPPCENPPASQWLADLLGIAEERIQRPFSIKDALDVLMLFEQPPPVAEIVAAVEDYRRAPETRELLDHARRLLDPPGVGPVIDRLATPAEREVMRRSSLAVPPPPEPGGSVRAHLAAGRFVHGLPLRQVDGRDDWHEVKVRHGQEATLLLTPVADYMLVTTEVVDPDDHAAGERELAKVDV
jgi:hypothetical protein